jgi:hypothetical protein
MLSPGTYTLRNRQSSLVLAVPNGEALCGQGLPKEVASIVPDTAAGTAGAANRSDPTGAAFLLSLGRNSYQTIAPVTSP